MTERGPSNYNQFPENEVTLRDVILKTRDYFRYLGRKWIWVVFGIIVGGMIGGIVIFNQKINYIADLTFVVNEDQGKSGGGISSALASFGLSSGSGGGFNYQKIIQLSKSQKILFDVLLDSVSYKDQKDLLAHHIIRAFNLEEEWNEGESIHFDSNIAAKLPLQQKAMLKRLYGMISSGSDPVFSLTFDETSQILSMQTTTPENALSILLAEKIYEILSNFYILQSISKSQETVDQLTARRDSLERILKRRQINLAVENDRSLGTIYQKDNVEKRDLSMDVQIIRTMYFEVVKNLETARFGLDNIRPVFTIIDTPMLPLRTDRKSLLISIILGSVIGVFLISIILFLSKTYNDLMYEDT
ncbi:hypothetical protein [Membranihabitans maritimus]|uniref:hypothetical protein n=1 Tax=Membranihabitans maritimus TaxID=2904244 RepID=UPI001F1F53AC|nr:hypothetical protein [Membranihabitans maritimus]